MGPSPRFVSTTSRFDRNADERIEAPVVQVVCFEKSVKAFTGRTAPEGSGCEYHITI